MLAARSRFGIGIGYAPSKHARHSLSAGCRLAAVSPSSETKASESAPIEARISSTPMPDAMSSARLAKSMP